jgi:hypothetical protein
MVANLTYRTSDGTRWGGGLGTDLTATQVDLNFWTLFQAVQSLENISSSGAGIDFINQPSGGNLFFVHLTNHVVLGPFVIPTAQWTPRGQWQPDTIYAAYDVVYEDGSLYLITVPHTSGATFSPFSTDGLGHLLYNLLLQQPADELPTGGIAGQRLVKSTSSPFSSAWEFDSVRLAVFVEGSPNPSEVLMQFCVTDHITFPVGLTGSVVFAGIPCVDQTVYGLNRNGASIGSITFNVSPPDVAVEFTAAVVCVPGDIISLVAPTTPDPNQANISFTIVAQLND